MEENQMQDLVISEEPKEEEKIADIFYTMKVTDEAGNEAEQLALKNDNYVAQESEYPPEAVQEWQEHKINSEYEPTEEFTKEGGAVHE